METTRLRTAAAISAYVRRADSRSHPSKDPIHRFGTGRRKPETARWSAENSINIACVGKSTTIRAYLRTSIGRTGRRGQCKVMPLLGMVRIVLIAGSDAQARALAAPAYARWIETSRTCRARDCLCHQTCRRHSRSLWTTALSGWFNLHRTEALRDRLIEAGVTYVMCQLAFGDHAACCIA